MLEMNKEDEIRVKVKIVHLVMDNVKEMLKYERNFIDEFGMTIDQFERLELDEQSDLIKKVAISNKFKKKMYKRYPNFTKVIEKNKIKGLFNRK